MFNLLMPVFAALFAIPLLDEPLEGYHLLAAGCIFTGIWLSVRKERQPDDSPVIQP